MDEAKFPKCAVYIIVIITSNYQTFVIYPVYDDIYFTTYSSRPDIHHYNNIQTYIQRALNIESMILLNLLFIANKIVF